MAKEFKIGKVIKVVITGPESTGKSTLCEQLARHYETIFIPEYARYYVENLGRSYTFEDVEHVARTQINEIKKYERIANKILFLDTYLIITKVWFDVVYKKCPAWVVNAIKQTDIDLFLLCDTDIPWKPDGVRENGGEMREKLFNIYQHELEEFGFLYSVLKGEGEKRLENAISVIDDFIKKDSLK